MADEIGLFEALHNMRAMRRLKPDPVPDALIRKIIAAGLCAPSGGDVQHWRFIVVKDPEIKQQIQRGKSGSREETLFSSPILPFSHSAAVVGL